MHFHVFLFFSVLCIYLQLILQRTVSWTWESTRRQCTKAVCKKLGNSNFAIGQFGSSESDCECILVFAIDCLNGEV